MIATSTSARCGRCRTCSVRRRRSGGTWRRTCSPPTACHGRRSPGCGCSGSGARWSHATSRGRGDQSSHSDRGGRHARGAEVTSGARKDSRDGRMVLVSLTPSREAQDRAAVPAVQRRGGRGDVAPRCRAAGCAGAGCSVRCTAPSNATATSNCRPWSLDLPGMEVTRRTARYGAAATSGSASACARWSSARRVFTSWESRRLASAISFRASRDSCMVSVCMSNPSVTTLA